MTDQHPITPPPELFKQWEDDILNERDNVDHVLDCAWRDGFRAGADAELEACCKWLPKLPPWSADDLRRHRRPKPPSLKEEALKILEEMRNGWIADQGEFSLLRRALEQLND